MKIKIKFIIFGILINNFFLKYRLALINMPQIIKTKNGKLYNSKFFKKNQDRLQLKVKNKKNTKETKSRKRLEKLGNKSSYSFFLRDFWSKKLKVDKNYFIIKEIVNICEKTLLDNCCLTKQDFEKIKSLAKKTNYKITKKDYFNFLVSQEIYFFEANKLDFNYNKSSYNNLKECEFHLRNLDQIISDYRNKNKIINDSVLKYFKFVDDFLFYNKM